MIDLKELISELVYVCDSLELKGIKYAEDGLASPSAEAFYQQHKIQESIDLLRFLLDVGCEI